MQPGTAHFVISTEDCLAVGGHFYSPGTLDRTMMCMVFERYVAQNITNTAHTKCGALFIRKLCYLNSAFAYANEKDSLWLPTARELAHMIVITAYLDQLAPFEVEDLSEDIQRDPEDDGGEHEGDVLGDVGIAVVGVLLCVVVQDVLQH